MGAIVKILAVLVIFSLTRAHIIPGDTEGEQQIFIFIFEMISNFFSFSLSFTGNAIYMLDSAKVHVQDSGLPSYTTNTEQPIIYVGILDTPCNHPFQLIKNKCRIPFNKTG